MTSGGEAAATLQSQEENPRVLIAGIGNIFLGDDGFGVEVVKRLQSVTLPHWVRVADFGIHGVHLAYEVLDTAYKRIILVDAAARGANPEHSMSLSIILMTKQITGPARRTRTV